VAISSSVLIEYFKIIEKFEEINQNLKDLANNDCSLKRKQVIMLLKQIELNKKFIKKLEKRYKN